tara:strand:+ start:4002 stop:4850 length:849 start_codon:yes stop_codon:yes gene_type:complete
VTPLEGKKPPGRLLDAATEVFESRFAKSGGSHYTVIVYAHGDFSSMMTDYMSRITKGDVEGAMESMKSMQHPEALVLKAMELVELKGLQTETTEYELTKADRLNEISWKGSISVTAEAQRRKDLDLSTVLNQMVENKESTISIPWTERKLTWVAIGENNLEEAPKAKDNSESVPDLNLFALMGGAFGGDADEFFAATDWNDWTTAEDMSFQRSDATLRDKNALLETIESAQVLGGKDTVFFRVPGEKNVGLDFVTTLANSGNETIFLLKPDLSAIRKAGLLK